MLTRLIDLCLNHRPVVLLAAALFTCFGLVRMGELPLDAFPDTTPVQVQVNTNAPALSPLEVERQVTFPIEQALSGLPGLREVRSVSKFGFSQVTTVFEDDAALEGGGLFRARQLVSERVGSVRLPVDVRPPSLGPIATGLGEVFQYVLHSETLSPEELRTLHHWVVRPQLVQVPGVAEINTWGGREKQVHVLVDPDALAAHELTLDDVARALREGNRNVGGGSLDQAGEALLVQGQGLATGPEDLASMVLAHADGVPVHLSDVAEVRVGHETRRGAVTYQGQGEAVLGLGFMLAGENSHALTERLRERLIEVEHTLPEGAALTRVYERTDLVDQVLETVQENLLEGALLVVAVLFMFLGSVRAGLIVALAIPLSMLFAFDAMIRFGIAGSLMSLGAIDFGLVVDSSVVMVENAARRVGEEPDRPVRDVVRDAAVEVRRPTLFGELVIAAVYLPVLTLEGIEGKLFRPMALTVVFALLGSMLLSVTLMPVLASYALERKRRPVHAQRAKRIDQVLMRALLVVYRPALARALAHPRLVLGSAVCVVLAAAGLATQLGSEFVPRLREQAVVINTVRIAGVSLDESVRYGTQIERLLLERFPDEVAHVWTRTGTAEVATDPMGLEVSDVFVTLTPRDEWTVAQDQDGLVDHMRATLDGLPGMRSIFTQPIEMRLNEMVAGIRADVGLELFGDDLDALRREADQLGAALEAIDGAADVSVEQLTGQAMLAIEIDREAAGRLGVPAGELLDLIASVGTRRVGEIVDGQRRFDVVLRLGEDARSTVPALRRLRVPTASGARVPLEQVARVEVFEGPSSIQRVWAKRRVVVQANVQGRDLGSFVADVQTMLADHPLPDGMYVSVGGQFENLERARTRLTIVIPLALLLVFGLLYLTYGTLRDALRVFVGVPFGAVGGVLALWARDLPFSISAGVGFVALCGVAVLGDMVLVARIRAVLDHGQRRVDAVREAALSRLRPVLMTALVAALGFVPMALNTGVGAEVQRPLATVVVGGMITATLATLIVLPVLYMAWRPRDRTPPPAD